MGDLNGAPAHHLCPGAGLPTCLRCYRYATRNRITKRQPWIEPRVDGDPPQCADFEDAMNPEDLPL